MKTVTAAIIKKGDKYLLTQRANHDKLALKWEFPGGKVEKDETPQECLAREIKEELNLDIEVKEKFATSVYNYGTGSIELQAYHAAIVGGEIKLIIHNDAKWVTPKVLLNFDLCPADIAIAKRIVEEDSILKGNDMNQSISYYNQNADKYCNSTLNVDISMIYQTFLQHLSPGGSILDVGCGSGRDSLYFKKYGYRVEAFDGSEEMVKRSSSLIGQEVLHCTFDEYKSDQLFDGIWACASLLHVEKEKLGSVIDRLAGFLKQGGAFYMSFKYGDRDFKKDGRIFSCFKEDDFTAMIEELDNLTIIELFQTVDARKDRPDEYWLNCLLERV